MASDQMRLREIADEQAALRRVATLVARAAPADVLFSAVVAEVGQLLGADYARLARYEEEDMITVMSTWTRTGPQLPVGRQFPIAGNNVSVLVLRSGRPARVDDFAKAAGPIAAEARAHGIRCTVGAPIIVDGRIWGVMSAGAIHEWTPPHHTEARLASFTDLLATAIANAQAEQELRALADTQAALRRLAMLVARGEPPEAVFAAVTREALRHFGLGTARMIRFELDGTATLVANEGRTRPDVQVGEPWVGYPPNGLTATVRRTGRAARVDDYGAIEGGAATLREGIRSAVAVPIHVEGRLWGLLAVGPGPLPPDLEQRMAEFTDLVAIAVANAQTRAELITSRARIVAASDEVRRRIERDLHDGAQQRLVALALRLRMAAAPHESDDAAGDITDVATELMAVTDELREICRGIHPAILSTEGLRPALHSLGRRCAIPVEMDVRIDDRLPEPVEVGAYYVVSEMLTNAAKHARASIVEVDAEASGGTLRVCVRDDGVGGADPRRGSGLFGLKDRIDALGGGFTLHSPPGGGTTVCCEFPVSADADLPEAGAGDMPGGGWTVRTAVLRPRPSPTCARCPHRSGYPLKSRGHGRKARPQHPQQARPAGARDRSSTGAGSTQIPRIPLTRRRSLPLAAMHRRRIPTTIDRVPMRCLLVDDNEAFLEAASVLLQRAGVTVVGVASSIAEALRQIRALRPDVVIVDIGLGDESGFELARILATDGWAEGVDVIMVSARAGTDYTELAAESRAAGFLEKSQLSAQAITRIVGH